VATRRRLDAELVHRGLVASRAEAQAAVSAGRVTVAGAPALKPARLVAPSEPVLLLGPPRRFVSRGGDKLDAALDAFGLDVTGVRALDAGASTGGFTDCLLQRGAAGVIAVDVGHGQLHPALRADARVDGRERTNVRTLTAAAVGGPVDLVVADLSFISLRTVAAALLGLVRPGGDLVLLVKPQFEAGRAEASRGRGVIRDDEVRQRVRDEVADVLTTGGAAIMGWVESPLRGADGNVEYFVHAVAPAAGDGSPA
jgi:23S rRNA (cytidine1920-2'-O)/16S rRNA (cytidine1409-2'-O)-methyltransferase